MGWFLRIVILLVVVATTAAGVWLYGHREELVRQWALDRIGAASSYQHARGELAWFEREPQRELKLRALVRKWGTGNEPFDRYLARYVGDPASSEALRRAFSLNLAWREGLLPRWARYWAGQPGPEPAQRMRSIVAQAELLLEAGPSRTLTWREVLDLQAVFTLTGQPRLALRLSPENWRERYRRWKAEQGGGESSGEARLPLRRAPDRSPVPFLRFARSRQEKKTGRVRLPWRCRPVRTVGNNLAGSLRTDASGIAGKEITWTTKRVVRIGDRADSRPRINGLHVSTARGVRSWGRIASLAGVGGLGTSPRHHPCVSAMHPITGTAGHGYQSEDCQQGKKRAFHLEGSFPPSELGL